MHPLLTLNWKVSGEGSKRGVQEPKQVKLFFGERNIKTLKYVTLSEFQLERLEHSFY